MLVLTQGGDMMRNIDLVIQFMMVVIAVLYFLSNDPQQIPIVELTSIIILISIFQLFQYWNNQVEGSNTTIQMIFMLIYLSLIGVTFYFVPLLFFMSPVWFFSLKWDIAHIIIGEIVLFIVGSLLGFGVYHVLMIMVLSFLSVSMSNTLKERRTFTEKTYEEIDSLRALNERFKTEQVRLLKIQDERIQSSVLSERKRIVGEIHDILGHQISSAVIQVGALKYVVTDEEVEQNLSEIQETLTSSMDNVREVIHRERETSIDLYQEMKMIANEFTKAKVNISYNGQSTLPNHVSHSFINILKEALTNINKHSNATTVTVRLSEMDDQWVYLIADNGTNVQLAKTTTGVGLINIEERINQLKGVVHFNTENGFRIFMKIPKEGE